LACPYFVPRQILNDGSWPHPSRLPLGAGWSGMCCASGKEKEAAKDHVREFCNLGNAVECPHLPAARDWDAIRFSVASASAERITLRFACENNHAPIAYGTLTYELASETWSNSDEDPRIQTLAGSYLYAYRSRKSGGFV
jgi:hypothetical protein